MKKDSSTIKQISTLKKESSTKQKRSTTPYSWKQLIHNWSWGRSVVVSLIFSSSLTTTACFKTVTNGVMIWMTASIYLEQPWKITLLKLTCKQQATDLKRQALKVTSKNYCHEQIPDKLHSSDNMVHFIGCSSLHQHNPMKSSVCGYKLWQHGNFRFCLWV
jgi:hypothetical protein